MQAIQPTPTTSATILAQLRDRGIAVSVEGTEIRFSGPVGSLTPALKAAITEHGAGLVEAITGFAQLDQDQDIIRHEAHVHTTEQIQERLAHSRQMAKVPGAAPKWAQAVRDWTAILAVKERRTDNDHPPETMTGSEAPIA